MTTIAYQSRFDGKMYDVELDSLVLSSPQYEIEFDEWVRLPDTIAHGGTIVRRRYKTFDEIGRAFHEALNRRVCPCGHEWQDKHGAWEKPCRKCGGEEHKALIDEYDAWDDLRRAHSPIADRDEDVAQIVCYCHVGGNEGYYAECGVLIRNYKTDSTRYVRLYWIKSFAGMAHVHMLVERMMKLTGVWAN